jgi:hypothetical protein
MRTLAIRTIDILLNPAAQMAWLVLFLVAGCQSGAPYSWDELARVDRYVESVEYLPRLEVDQRCDGWRLNGCAYLLDGRIYIVNHDSIALRECILQHELSHFYDVYILGRTLEQTRTHEGWLAKYCYAPPVRSTQPFGGEEDDN